MTVNSWRVIDVHHHWVNEPEYLSNLLRQMDRLHIERTGLMALGAPFQRLFLKQPEPVGCCDNLALASVINSKADRFFGYGFFRLGHNDPTLIDWFADKGFAGVKFHIPDFDYDDERAFPVYERAARLRLPCLFHTGVFYLPETLPGVRLSSARCRPVMLDPVANEFPSMPIILAHLGVCWGEEAATLCRIYPNIYADLSGRLDGWLSSKSIEWFKEMLYWPKAHRKILFGSDVHCDELEATLTNQIRIFRGLGWDEQQIQNVLYNNAQKVFTQETA